MGRCFLNYLNVVDRLGLEQSGPMCKEFRTSLIVPPTNLTEKLTIRVDRIGRRNVDLFQDDFILVGIDTKLKISSIGGL